MKAVLLLALTPGLCGIQPASFDCALQEDSTLLLHPNDTLDSDNVFGGLELSMVPCVPEYGATGYS